MASNDSLRILGLPVPRMHSSLEELNHIIEASGRVLPDLLGPTFSRLSVAEEGQLLISVARQMPDELQEPTMNLGINLLHTGDWSSEILTAARHGDPIAKALAESILRRVGADFLSSMPPDTRRN